MGVLAAWHACYRWWIFIAGVAFGLALLVAAPVGVSADHGGGHVADVTVIPNTTNGVYTNTYEYGIGFTTSASVTVNKLRVYHRAGATIPTRVTIFEASQSGEGTYYSGCVWNSSGIPNTTGWHESGDLGSGCVLPTGGYYISARYGTSSTIPMKSSASWVDRSQGNVNAHGHYYCDHGVGGGAGCPWTEDSANGSIVGFPDFTFALPTPTPTPTPAPHTFEFEQGGRTAIEVVGKAGTQGSESNFKVGGTPSEYDWLIQTYDSQQRSDDLRSQQTTARNETVFSDCVTVTAYEITPWEADDLPSSQWKSRWTLLGAENTVVCGGGGAVGRGLLQVPQVTGVVTYDPYTGTCFAYDQDSRKYFDQSWSCTYVLVNGVLQAAATATPVAATPTPIPPGPTVTPYATVAQQFNPDVAGAVNRQTDTQAGWFGQITSAVQGVGAAVNNLPNAMATAVGVPGPGYVEGKLSAVGGVVEQKAGGMPGIASSLATGWEGLTEPTCEGWTGFPVTMRWFGVDHAFNFFAGGFWDNVYCPYVRIWVGLGLSAWFTYNSVILCYQLAKPGGK